MDKRVDSESVRFLAVVALWFEPCSGHMGKPSSAYGLLEFSPGSPVFAHLWWTIGLIKVRYSLRAVKHKIKKKKKENKVTSCNKGHDYGCQCSANIRKMFVWFLFVVFFYIFLLTVTVYRIVFGWLLLAHLSKSSGRTIVITVCRSLSVIHRSSSTYSLLVL